MQIYFSIAQNLKNLVADDQQKFTTMITVEGLMILLRKFMENLTLSLQLQIHTPIEAMNLAKKFDNLHQKAVKAHLL